MLENVKKIGSDNKLNSILAKDEPIKLPPIRHLVFKPYSGNHMDY